MRSIGPGISGRRGAKRAEKERRGLTPSAEDYVFLPSRSPGRSQRHPKAMDKTFFQVALTARLGSVASDIIRMADGMSRMIRAQGAPAIYWKTRHPELCHDAWESLIVEETCHLYHVILSAAKDLVLEAKNEILPSCVGQDASL